MQFFKSSPLLVIIALLASNTAATAVSAQEKEGQQTVATNSVYHDADDFQRRDAVANPDAEAKNVIDLNKLNRFKINKTPTIVKHISKSKRGDVEVLEPNQE